MKIEIKRTVRDETCCFGRLLIDGEYFCDTLELPEERAIPYGFYALTLNVVSLRFGRYKVYEKIGYRLPRLLNVPGREGILIHPGNSVDDTSGCILVGKRGHCCRLLNSRNTFFALYERLEGAVAAGESLELTIVGGE